MPKASSVVAFIKAWVDGNEDMLEIAFRKEASRQVGEMERWMKNQIATDPEGMLWYYSDAFFPLIDKAVRYRMRIYNRNRLVDQIQFDIMAAEAAGEEEKVASLREQWLDIVDEQIALCWRIKRIHCKVVRDVRLELAEGDKDPFEEYVYDPAKS